MLDSMRRHANSWVFSLLFAVIIFVFAVNFGPWAGRVAPVTLFAVEVNGRAVSMNEFEAFYSDQVSQMQMFRGVTREQLEQQGFSNQVLDYFVRRELLAQLAEANNLTVTDEEVARQITGGVPFDEEKKKQYEKNIEEQYHITAGEFEARTRRNLLAARMEEILLAGMPITETDLKTSYVIKNEQVAVDFIRIDPAHFQGKDKDQKMEEAKKYAASIIDELKTGKKIDHVVRADLTKKEKGSEPSAADVAPVFGSSELFTRNQVKITGFGFTTPEILSSAFGLAGDTQYTTTPVLANGRLYILALRERKAADLALFDKEKDALRSSILQQRSNEFLNEFVAHLKDKYKDKIVYNEALRAGRSQVPADV